jgi:hypothetical protein
MTMSHRPWIISVVAISILLLACSNAPTTSEGTTPFVDAKNNFKVSDFSAALTNLDKAIKWTHDDAVRQESIMLRTALVTALADANKQMAEACYTGAKQPAGQGHTGAFYQKRSDYYKTAQGYLMDAMQAVMDQRGKMSATPVSVEVSYPGFMATNAALTKIKLGQEATDSEGVSAELQQTRNSFAIVLAEIAGAGQDANKGQQAYSSGKVDVDPRVYLLELSNSFLQIGQMFDFHGLNSLDKQRTVIDVVHGNLDAVDKMLVAKPDKDLEARAKKLRADCDNALAPKKKA